jgi:aryl-alcohol dehydrogenase-like predicted oxidoreductase
MNSRSFGGDSLKVSEVGIGCWQLGSEWGTVSDEQAVQILDAAMEAGITCFDTADIYGQGLSERRVAAMLKRHSESSVTVLTKFGRMPEPGWPDNFTPAAIRKHTEDSLQRLGVDALDLTQLHCLPTDRFAEIFDALRQLKQEGKIRRFGASVESMDEAMLCLEEEGLASLQTIFNVFRQKPIETLFPLAKEKGVAIIVRLPLASGLLSGKFKKNSTFPENDHRNFNKNGEAFNVGETFAGLPFEKGVELADKFSSLAPDGMTPAQLALRWILDFDAVTTIIPGAKSAEQVQMNASTSDLPSLSAELHAELKKLYQEEVHPHIRGPY